MGDALNSESTARTWDFQDEELSTHQEARRERQKRARYESNEAELGALFRHYIDSGRADTAEGDVLAWVMDHVRHTVEGVYKDVFESRCDWQTHAEDKCLEVVDRVGLKLREGGFPSFASILAYIKQPARFYVRDAVKAKVKVNTKAKALPAFESEAETVAVEQVVPELVPGGRRMTTSQITILRSLPLKDQRTLTLWQMNDCDNETTAAQMGLKPNTFDTKINRIKKTVRQLTLLRTAQTA